MGYCLSILPENIRKPKIFFFEAVHKVTSGMNWVKKSCSNRSIQWQAQSQRWEQKNNAMNVCKVNNQYNKHHWRFSRFFIVNQNIHYINQLQPSVVFHTETTDTICRAIQMTGFYMKWNSELKLAKPDIILECWPGFQYFQGVFRILNLKCKTAHIKFGCASCIGYDLWIK